jgi:hypothetical protein
MEVGRGGRSVRRMRFDYAMWLGLGTALIVTIAVAACLVSAVAAERAPSLIPTARG